jgi:hypothetical protein
MPFVRRNNVKPGKQAVGNLATRRSLVKGGNVSVDAVVGEGKETR